MLVPTFLSEIVRTIIIMTISGGAITLLLLAIKPFTRNHLPKSAQYYFWLVVLMALLVPVSRVFVLPERAENIAPIPIVAAVERNIISIAEETHRLAEHSGRNMPNFLEPDMAAPMFPIGQTVIHPAEPLDITPGFFVVAASTIFMSVYPWVALLVLIYNLVGYAFFAKKLRRGYAVPHKEELELLACLTNHIKNKARLRAHFVQTNFLADKKPQLYISDFAATPMLIGIFKPTIVLPNRDYTEDQLESILLHELTHMRRFDIAVKWVSLLACAIHWFNPLVWLARREIDRTCELSCDEAVIRNMDSYAKQIYGNTLIDVATDTKIPLPVLSTTMCEEKRALKERLSAIMKSKKHTKLAVFVSMIIVLLAVFASCSLGASRRAGNTEDADDYNMEVTTTSPPSLPTASLPIQSPIDFATSYVQSLLQTFDHPHVNIVDSRIRRFEKAAEFDQFLPYTIELWTIVFDMRVEYEAFVRWGGGQVPDADGWMTPLLHFPAPTHMIFARDGDTLTHMGNIEWGRDSHLFNDFGEVTPWGAELLVRTFLVRENLLPQVIFPGNHYFVYVHFGSETYMRFLMSQPVTQGSGGIWAIESFQHFAPWGWGEGHAEYAAPLSQNLTMTEYFAEQQLRLDSQVDTIHATIESALNSFSDGFVLHNTIVGIYQIPLGTTNPLDMPNSHGPSPRIETEEERSFRTTEWPTDFRGEWAREFNPEFIELRERIFAEIGGLEFNEAYHFRMDDGRFALITGWRSMLTREEFARFYPGFDMPEQVGDFRLVGVNVNDTMFDAIRIYNNPIPNRQNTLSVNLFTDYPSIPIGEIFTRNLWAFSFHAVYVNSAGEYVGVGIFPSNGNTIDNMVGWMSDAQTTIPPHGEVTFVGANDRYAVAMAQSADTILIAEIGFLNPSRMSPVTWGWASSSDFGDLNVSSMAQLTELVNIFNPTALFEGIIGQFIAFGWYG